MVNLYVLDPNDFSICGVVDGYSSLIWRPAYYDIGDFELYINATSETMDLMKSGRYLVRDFDIEVTDGIITYRNVMIIKNIDGMTDVEEGDYLSITGRELKYLLHSRIVWSQTNLSGNVETAIRSLVTDNAISPSNTNRIIPTLTLDAESGITESITMQITGKPLDESIVSICTNYHLGWEIYISDNALKFRVYKGTDRSYGQSVNPYVVFSDAFDNLHSSEYQLSTEEYSNCALVGGEGEGTERTYSVVNDSYSGLNRFETFVDAKDISQNKGSDEAITEEEYLLLLQEKGIEELAKLAMTEGFSGEVISDVTYKYRTDFFIGDTVTVINKYGISKDVFVLSAIESIDENGTKLIPQFNI